MLPSLVVLAVAADTRQALVLSQTVLSSGLPFVLVPLPIATCDARLTGGLPSTIDPRRRWSRPGLSDTVAAMSSDAARDGALPSQTSLFDVLLGQPEAPTPLTLDKRTLIGLSHAIEDECVTAGSVLYGAFQHGRYFRGSRRRWTELARRAADTVVFARFDLPAGADEGGVIRVPLAEDAPLLMEWDVIVDNSRQPVALTAIELPGQDGVPQMDRAFSSVWTLRSTAVRAAARAAREAAEQAGAVGLAPLTGPTVDSVDPRIADRLYMRSVAYVARSPGARRP